MNHARSWKEKLPGIALALAVQGAFFAVLAFSFTVVTRAPERETEVIYLLPRVKPPPSEPMVIDARPKRPATPPGAVTPPPPAAPAIEPPAPSGNPITARQPEAPPLLAPRPAAPAAQQPGRATVCEPRCIPAPAPDPGVQPFNPPSGVKDFERWEKEKAPQKSGLAVGPGIGIVIQDPLCKLAWVLLGGGFHCGAPPKSTRPATDEQFKAALDAYHKRRGGGPKPALASAQTGENKNEEDRTAGAGAQPGPGAGR